MQGFEGCDAASALASQASSSGDAASPPDTNHTELQVHTDPAQPPASQPGQHGEQSAAQVQAVSASEGTPAPAPAASGADSSAQEQEPTAADASGQAARDAASPRDSQIEGDAVGNTQFTPDQQKVAAALMVVLKRAMQKGKEPAQSAKRTLISNNPLTCPFLGMLPDEEPLPTMRRIQQRAPSNVPKSLSLLAEQCAAAGFQPLVVFQRSMQCTKKAPAWEHKAAQGSICQRQQQLIELQRNIEAADSTFTQYSWTEGAVSELRKRGLSAGLASLTVKFLRTFSMMQQGDPVLSRLHRPELDHMLPGKLISLLCIAGDVAVALSLLAAAGCLFADVQIALPGRNTVQSDLKCNPSGANDALE